MRKKYVIFIIITVILIPIYVNLLMSFSTPWTNGNESDWISFYGNFVGGVITLIALFITLKHNESDQNKLRHDSVRPYIRAWHLNGAVDCDDLLRKVPTYDFVYSPNKKAFLKKVKFDDGNGNRDMFIRGLVVENIGQGIAAELTIKLKDDKNNSYGINDTVSLGVGNKEIYRFLINKNYIKVGQYKIIFYYEDILRKKFFQEIELKIVEDSTQSIGVNLNDFLKISPQKERN